MAEDLHVVCAVILHPDGRRILAAQRASEKSLGGKWEFPGGKVDAGEAPADALRREILEEMGVTIAIHEEMPTVRHHYPKFTIRLVPFLSSIEAGEPEAREHQALQWIAPERWQELDWADADIPVLKAFLLRNLAQEKR